MLYHKDEDDDWILDEWARWCERCDVRYEDSKGFEMTSKRCGDCVHWHNYNDPEKWCRDHDAPQGRCDADPKRDENCKEYRPGGCTDFADEDRLINQVEIVSLSEKIV